MVEQSKVLNTPGAEKQTKRKLFDSLGRELEWVFYSYSLSSCNSSTRKGIYKAVWELILDVDGLGKEISDTVEKVFRWLSSIELPMPTPQSQAALVAHAETRGDEEVEIPKPSARKRSFVEMSMQDGAETLANISIVQVAVGSESVTAPGTNGTTFGTNQS